MFEKLLAKAKIARKNAYSPFSRFQVGASILTSNNNYYVGSSIENPSFSQTLCAEASAIAAMVTAGERKIKTILVVGGDDNGVLRSCPNFAHSLLGKWFANVFYILPDFFKRN